MEVIDPEESIIQGDVGDGYPSYTGVCNSMKQGKTLPKCILHGSEAAERHPIDVFA